MEMSTRRFVLEERAIRANNFIDWEIFTAQLLYSFKITESAGNLRFRPVFLMCSSGFQAGKAKTLVLFIVVPAKRTSFGARIAKQQDETTKKCQNVLQMVRRLKISQDHCCQETSSNTNIPPPSPTRIWFLSIVFSCWLQNDMQPRHSLICATTCGFGFWTNTGGDVLDGLASKWCCASLIDRYDILKPDSVPGQVTSCWLLHWASDIGSSAAVDGPSNFSAKASRHRHVSRCIALKCW